MASYYGLKDSSGNIIEKGWTTLPQLKLYALNINTGQWYETYADTSAGIRLNDTMYSAGPAGGFPYSAIPKASTATTIYSSGYSGNSSYYQVTGTVAGRYERNLTHTVGLNETVYASGGTTKYTVCQYYKFSVSASTNPVDNKQVGNIALYNGSTLVKGSVAKNTKGDSTFNWSITTEASSLSLKFVATALTSYISSWHNQYFYNGITKNTSTEILDSDISFTQDTASYSFTLTASSVTFNVNYGKKYALVIGTLPTGVSSTAVSYSRHHSTGNYVSDSTSPVSLSGAGTLYVEDGSAVNFSAQASAGYVFTNSTGFWSQVDDDYDVFGNGTNAISRTPGLAMMLRDHSYALTVTSYQISVSISDESKNDWGTVYIDNDNPRVTSKRLVQGTTYNFHFESSKDGTVAPVVDYWTVGGQRIQGSSYTASTLTGSVVVKCVLKQTAWPVTVEAGSSGTATVIGRYRKIDGASLPVGYLYANGSDYIKISVTPNDHFEETVGDRVVNNLEE